MNTVVMMNLINSSLKFGDNFYPSKLSAVRTSPKITGFIKQPLKDLSGKCKPLSAAGAQLTFLFKLIYLK